MRTYLPYTELRGLIARLPSSHVKPTFVRSRALTRTTRTSRTLDIPPTNPMTGYNWVEGVEKIESYETGGYHPVIIGDVIHGRYTIVDKLGFGGYSTVWVARDDKTHTLVALKVGVSRPSPAQREPEILRALSTTSSLNEWTVRASADYGDVISNVLDDFEVQGPNGTHRCYTMDLMQGDLRAASFSRLFPIRVVRALAAKLVLAVDHVHSRGFVHGDIRLCNMLTKAPLAISNLSIAQFREQFSEPEMVPVSRVDGKPLPPGVPTRVVIPLDLNKKAQEFTMDDAKGVVLCDFGEAFEPAIERRYGRDCNTPAAKRAPEAAFEPDQSLSYPSDVWSLGVAVWEILGMKAIFSESEPENEIIAEQIDVLGLRYFPAEWSTLWESSKITNTDPPVPKRPQGKRDIWPPLEHAFEEFVQTYRRKREVTGVFDEEETRVILDLFQGMLRFRPEERLTTQEVLRSEWMVKWALPELEKT